MFCLCSNFFRKKKKIKACISVKDFAKGFNVGVSMKNNKATKAQGIGLRQTENKCVAANGDPACDRVIFSRVAFASSVVFSVAQSLRGSIALARACLDPECRSILSREISEKWMYYRQAQGLRHALLIEYRRGVRGRLVGSDRSSLPMSGQ